MRIVCFVAGLCFRLLLATLSKLLLLLLGRPASSSESQELVTRAAKKSRFK